MKDWWRWPRLLHVLTVCEMKWCRAGVSENSLQSISYFSYIIPHTFPVAVCGGVSIIRNIQCWQEWGGGGIWLTVPKHLGGGGGAGITDTVAQVLATKEIPWGQLNTFLGIVWHGKSLCICPTWPQNALNCMLCVQYHPCIHYLSPHSLPKTMSKQCPSFWQTIQGTLPTQGRCSVGL